MNRSAQSNISSTVDRHIEEARDLDALLHPWQAFAHPFDVVRDVDLTTGEKRAILASWASDACAVEAAPALRASASGEPVTWDDIMDALKELDQPLRTNLRTLSPARVRISPYKRCRRSGKLRDRGPSTFGAGT